MFTNVNDCLYVPDDSKSMGLLSALMDSLTSTSCKLLILND